MPTPLMELAKDIAAFLPIVITSLISFSDESTCPSASIVILDNLFGNNRGNVRGICLTNDDLSGLGEGLTASQFNTDNTLDNQAGTNCKSVTAIIGPQGFATIGPLVFQVPQNIPIGEDIKGIGICKVPSGASSNVKNKLCAFNDSVLFAAIDTTDVLNLQQDQTVSIRYEFDMRSPDT